MSQGNQFYIIITILIAKMKIRLDKSGKIVYHYYKKYSRGGMAPKRRTEYHYG